MLREIQSPQRGVRHLYFYVDGSVVAGGTLTRTGMLIGSNDGLITETGAGLYTITFTKPGTRLLNAQGTAVTDVTTCRIVAADTDHTKVSINHVGADQATEEADGDFYVMVVLQDASAET